MRFTHHSAFIQKIKFVIFLIIYNSESYELHFKGWWMLQIYQNALLTQEIYTQWEEMAKKHNFGAFCLFCGIVREEGGNDGLSFEIYQPLFFRWFDRWKEIGQKENLIFCIAHSVGDVFNGQSSYMSAILSSNRKNALKFYESFIEDFKHNAPIWKYDLKGNQKIYAKDRSYPIKGSGILI